MADEYAAVSRQIDALYGPEQVAELEPANMARLHREAHARMLGNGLCTRPVELECRSEYSSGDRTRRGHLTRAGNVHVRTQLVESAWAYNHPARLTKTSLGATRESAPRPWTGPGPPSNACAGASAILTNVRTYVP